jgi:hypothetical protein
MISRSDIENLAPDDAVKLIYNNAIDDCKHVVEKFRQKVRLTNFYNALFHELIRELNDLKELEK